MSGISAITPRPPLAGLHAPASDAAPPRNMARPAGNDAPPSGPPAPGPGSVSPGLGAAPARPGIDGPAPAQATAIPESLNGTPRPQQVRMPLFEGRLAGPPPAFHSNLLDQRQDIRTLIDELDKAREADSKRLEQERTYLLLAPDSPPGTGKPQES